MVSNDLSGKKIQNNGKVDESCENSNVGDINYPDLIYGCDNQVLDEIVKYGLRMITIGSSSSSFSNSADKVALSHYSEHSLVVSFPSLSVKFLGHSSVPIFMKLKADSFYLVLQIHILLEFIKRFSLGSVVESAFSNSHQLTSLSDASDEFLIGVNEPSFLSRSLRVFCKAFFKKLASFGSIFPLSAAVYLFYRVKPARIEEIKKIRSSPKRTTPEGRYCLWSGQNRYFKILFCVHCQE